MVGPSLKLVLAACSLIGSLVYSQNADEKADILSNEIVDTFGKISAAHSHKVDWVFVIDHGGFQQNIEHEYSKYFVREITNLLYIAPQLSRAAVITYGSGATTPIPFTQPGIDQCSFKSQLHFLKLTTGQSNLANALTLSSGLTSYRAGPSHRVTVLITTAGWANIGSNPSDTIEKIKQQGDLIVFVMVFDKEYSIMAPVLKHFASTQPANAAFKTTTGKLSFQVEADLGKLRRLYRRLYKAVASRPYIPLQVDKSICARTAAGTCSSDSESCVCDVILNNTYHCEIDVDPPVLTRTCPNDTITQTDAGSPTASVSWTRPQSFDYSGKVHEQLFINGTEIVPIPGGSTITVQMKLGIGNHSITHRFTDTNKNSISCSFAYTVMDNEAPTVGFCPVELEEYTNGKSYKLMSFPGFVVIDNSGETLTVRAFQESRLQRDVISASNITIGSHYIDIEWADPYGNRAHCNFTATLIDNEPPKVMQCNGPADIVYSSGTIARVDWIEPVFVDNSGLPVTLNSTSLPGEHRLGSHAVTYTAMDVYNNTASCSFRFTVSVYPCDNLTVPANGALVCDKTATGGSCQIFCQNPYEFNLDGTGLQRVPEKYVCIGVGKWQPSAQVPECTHKQSAFKLMPDSYYFNLNCSASDANMTQTAHDLLKQAAAYHFRGFVQGSMFKTAYGREIATDDFDDPICGDDKDIVDPWIPTTIPTPILTTVAETTSDGQLLSSFQTTPGWNGTFPTGAPFG